MLDEGTPIFVQIASLLAEEIAAGTLREGDRAPSTNELAAYHRINPATAAKGINVLIDDGLLEKRRGIGMFVAPGAQTKVLDDRRRQFADRYVEPMVAEAQRIGLGAEALLDLVRTAADDHATNDHSGNDHAGNGKGASTP